jgi:hypothetical protein
LFGWNLAITVEFNCDGSLIGAWASIWVDNFNVDLDFFSLCVGLNQVLEGVLFTWDSKSEEG